MRGAILAGGAASRYGGRPKGLDRVGGERILDRVATALRSAIGELPLVVANADEATAWLPGHHVVPDAIRDCGSLGGVYTAVTAGDGPVLVLGWDMPFVTPDLLEALVRDLADYDVFLPESEGPLGVEPLCAVYAPGCAPLIRASLDEEDYRTTAFHDYVAVGTLPLARVREYGDPEELFFNVNAPNDLAEAEARWRRGRTTS